MMILIRLLMKVILLPVLLILTVLKIFLQLATNMISFIAGLLTLYIFVCIVMTLVRHQWSSALILFFIESGVILAMFFPIAAGELLDSAGSRLGAFLRS